LDYPLVLKMPKTMTSLFIERCLELPAVIIDTNSAVIHLNAKFTKALGYDQQEVMDQHFNQFVALGKPVQSWYAEEYNKAPLKAQGLAVDVNHKDGHAISTYISVVALEHPDSEADGSNYYGYVVLLNDTQFMPTLNLLQQFAGTFIRDVNLGVLLISKEFKLIEISDMACRILGIDQTKTKNIPMEEVFAAVPNEHRLVQRTILDGLIVRNHAVSWMNNQDRYELLMDSSLLKDEAGNTVGAYVIFKDVSNLRSLEEQVQRSDRLAMIGQIAAGTAHEIRNPLTSIKGFLQVLKNTLKEAGFEKEHGFTEIMLTEINRINELVSEFLLLSKQRNVTYVPVDIPYVIKDILPIINNEAILHDVTVKYEPVDNLPSIIADRELLKQVCINICKNGIEAMKQTGGQLIIKERIGYEEEQVHIDIQDTGPGIPSFLIDKIFDPFFTTKEEGTGLGLSVCQRIIHDLGGTIRVSTKGFGTTFTVSLPFTA
jgi:two-component system, sporulation sensor kinase E